MRQPMRIAMLLHKSVEFDSRVRREASALARAGHEVTVLELAPVPAGARLDGFRRQSVAPPAWLRRLLPFHLYRVAFALSFLGAIRGLRPDVVHAHDAAMLLPGIAGARLTGARLIYDSHELATGVPYRERGWASFVAAVERLVVPRCAAVITVSDGIAASLRGRYGLARSPTVVRNLPAWPVSGGGGLRRRLGLGDESPLVLHQGAAAPGRGCDVLVRAAARLEGVHVVFLGDPEPGYRSILEREIEANRMKDRVRMIPSAPLERLLGYTAEADVGVTLLQDTCENHRLALPNKLFEYVAAGVPVVGSALPEVERFITTYGVGEVARPDDPQAVAESIASVLQKRGDPALRARLQRTSEELTWAREQERLLSLYASLIGESVP